MVWCRTPLPYSGNLQNIRTQIRFLQSVAGPQEPEKVSVADKWIWWTTYEN